MEEGDGKVECEKENVGKQDADQIQMDQHVEKMRKGRGRRERIRRHRVEEGPGMTVHHRVKPGMTETSRKHDQLVQNFQLGHPTDMP